MKLPGRSASRRLNGFTLIELMVTVAIAALFVRLVVPSFRAIAANQILSSAASELLSSALQARSAALKYNRRVVVQPVTGTDWRTGWIVYTDINMNATYDSGTDELIASSPALSSDIAQGSVSGAGESQNSISIIAYDPDGFIATVGGSRDGSVLLSSSFTSRQKFVIVSRIGRVRLCDPKTNPGCQPSSTPG
jgi:type IV fimbrial biogenesis protein FimT